MGTVRILRETTVKPITLIGERAGICTGADTSSEAKNYKRGLGCIRSEHGRLLEFPRVDMELDGYSARVIREWYTHIGGMPTRLQESTRYVDYGDFEYVTPPGINDDTRARAVFEKAMCDIVSAAKTLENLGVAREDIAMLYPLGMQTKIIDSRNLRNLVDMSRQRMCARAYWEFRQLFRDILNALSDYSDEWKTIVNELKLMKPKCEYLGYCPEKNGCGRVPKKDADAEVAEP